jgi:hypothetical protein
MKFGVHAYEAPNASVVAVNKTGLILSLHIKFVDAASVKLGLHFNTFKRYALLFGCYKTNPSGKGMKKKGKPKVDLDKILSGEHPEFQTFKLKNRLLKNYNK